MPPHRSQTAGSAVPRVRGHMRICCSANTQDGIGGRVVGRPPDGSHLEEEWFLLRRLLPGGVRPAVGFYI